jgi:hypothetical protein
MNQTKKYKRYYMQANQTCINDSTESTEYLKKRSSRISAAVDGQISQHANSYKMEQNQQKKETKGFCSGQISQHAKWLEH